MSLNRLFGAIAVDWNDGHIEFTVFDAYHRPSAVMVPTTALLHRSFPELE